MPQPSTATRPRLLIEEWLPIAEIGIESVRERTPMTPFPAPNRLHVWWARRPLVASRAAVLASLLPADADRTKFLHVLGIHGDPVAAKERIAQATRDGVRLGKEAYGYSRAFSYSPTDEDIRWIHETRARHRLPNDTAVLDPTAGGGSIPFESSRLRCNVLANDLNPVAWLILKATVEFPARFGQSLLKRFKEIGEEFRRRVVERLHLYYPPEPLPDCVPDGYLWARTIICPYCGGLVPLSPNWRLDGHGAGVKLQPQTADPEHRHCTFEMVKSAKEQSAGTVKGGDGLCPFPDCARVIDGDEIKTQAQTGKMGQQLYAVVYKQKVKVGVTKGKAPKDKFKTVRGFRAPRPEDDVSAEVEAALAAKMPEWRARNVVPDEEIDKLSNYDRGHRLYGIMTWKTMFAPRQLFGHCTSVAVFHEMVDEIRRNCNGTVSELDKAALTYLAFALSKMLNWNALASSWNVKASRLRSVFDRHDFSFKWSFGEMAPTITGLGYDWTIEETCKSLEELLQMTASGRESSLFSVRQQSLVIELAHASADALPVRDGAVDAIVMDPPYEANVMYAELSDFFYVWLNTTAQLTIPLPEL
jgi:adenine-specific DNA methylase